MDYECLGSLYLSASADFQRGLFPISRTVKAEQHDLGVFLLNVRGGGKSLNEVLQIGNIMEDRNFENPQCGRVYDAKGVSPTLNTMQGGQRQPIVMKFKDNDMSDTMILDPQGRDHISEYRDDILEWLMENAEVRRLSPRECGRLMNCRDEDIDKILEAVSNSQAYKQFGNSITVNCLVGIFSQLNISNIKPWNEMEDKEKRNLI